MTDTPMTDGLVEDGPYTEKTWAANMRHLERENQRLREALERYMEISDAPPPLKNFARAALEGK